MHVEKIVFAGIALLAGMVVYFGFTAKPFSGTESPAKLQENANQVSRSIKEDHWESIKTEEGRIIAPVFLKAAKESLLAIPTDLYPPPRPPADIFARRGDPVLPAPQELEVKYFYGSISRFLPAGKDDLIEKLDDAKKPDPPKQRKSAASTPGYGSDGGMASGGMASGGMGGYTEGGMGGGYGGGMPGYGGDSTTALGVRKLAFGYDLGFRMGMKTFQDSISSMGAMSGMSNYGSEGMTNQKPVAPKKTIPFTVGCVVVTALAPHQDMEADYKSEFYKVVGYMEGRDTPNYVGFEAQRVEIDPNNPNKEITEADWQSLPYVSPASYKEDFIKKLPGSCSEVHLSTWTDPNISMPILPFLLDDYKKYASHSKIPTLIKEESDAVNPAGGMPGMGGYGGSMGGGYGDAGSGYGGMGDSGGFTEGGGGMQSGYPGGMGGESEMGGGYPGGGKGSGGGMASSGPGGMGGGMYGESGYGGGMGGTGMTMMEMPKKLPSTKHKLVRFYDYKALPGKVYRYRVRLLMYDPNYPEWAQFKPDLSKLTQAALRRIQIQEQKEPKDNKAASATKPATTASSTTFVMPTKRTSRRESAWSEPSQPILTVKPASVYTARKDEEKPELLLVDHDKDKSVNVPRKEVAVGGLVFGTSAKVLKGKEAPAEIIHPTLHVIKWLRDFRSSNYVSKFVTVVELKGLSPLSVANSKDPLKTGSEIVSYDPVTGQIVVSREFDNFTNFHMFAQPDSPAVGPLGGGLTGAGAAAGGGMYGGMGEGGMYGGGSGSDGGMAPPGGPGGGGGPGGKGK